MNIVTIKEVKSVVECTADGTAEHVFNVKNSTDKALIVGMHLSLSETTNAEWLRIDGPTEHDLAVETMTQVTVKIQVPSDCAPGQYSYRLRVFDPDSPGEKYTDGDPVYFEVPAKKEEVIKKEENGKQPFKWWIPAAIAAGVIVIGVVIWLVWPAGVKMPDFTQKEWSQAKAEEFIKLNGLSGKFELQQDPKPGSDNEIIGQVPEPDTKLKEGAKVTLKIAGIKVPEFKGLSFSAALQRISSNKFTFNDKSDLRIRNVSRADQHEKVLDQKPQSGELVAKKSAMQLTVGRLANKKFIIKQLSQVKAMPGIKMSPAFIKREVAPAPE